MWILLRNLRCLDSEVIPLLTILWEFTQKVKICRNVCQLFYMLLILKMLTGFCIFCWMLLAGAACVTGFGCDRETWLLLSDLAPETRCGSSSGSSVITDIDIRNCRHTYDQLTANEGGEGAKQSYKANYSTSRSDMMSIVFKTNNKSLVINTQSV